MADDQESLDRWRGRISSQVESIVVAVQASRTEQAKAHEELRTSLEHHYNELDSRIKPLEQLRLILIGIAMALGLMVPAIWLYASKLNMLLERVQKILPPDAPGKP